MCRILRVIIQLRFPVNLHAMRTPLSAEVFTPFFFHTQSHLSHNGCVDIEHLSETEAIRYTFNADTIQHVYKDTIYIEHN